MPAANPCHAHAGSLTEAWELTEACLLEEGALRFLAQRLAVGAVAALLCVAALASLGLYAKRLRRDQREPPPLLPTHPPPDPTSSVAGAGGPPRAIQWALRLLRLAFPVCAAVAVASVSGVLDRGPVADVGRRLEAMLRGHADG